MPTWVQVSPLPLLLFRNVSISLRFVRSVVSLRAYQLFQNQMTTRQNLCQLHLWPFQTA